MKPQDWENQFRKVHAHGVAAWNAGRRSPQKMFTPEDTAFLASIGCTQQELFDFIDDLQAWGEPCLDSTLEVQRVRRDFFIQIMASTPSCVTASMTDLPPKSAEIDGIAWLPRLIVKARLKLRGEMPPELMYGCGGDRPFLRRLRMSLAEFLRLVWECGDDDRKIVDSVKRAAGLPASGAFSK